VLGVAATAVLVLAASAHAQLVQNGGFETTTGGTSGQLGYNGFAATDWTVQNIGNGTYTFLFNAGTSDTTGANGEYNNLSLWGPGDGSNNGLPAASPAGGNFIAQDSDFQVGPLQQTINGLTVDNQYTLGFYWAAAQQYNFYGPNSSGWQVSLGSQTYLTDLDTIASQGFSGWQYQTYTFTASSSSELLSFLAYGNPQVPPFALLDGVTLNVSAPEGGTSSLYLLLAGAVCFGAMFVIQRKKLGASSR
jgi:hypothetical protein